MIEHYNYWKRKIADLRLWKTRVRKFYVRIKYYFRRENNVNENKV